MLRYFINKALGRWNIWKPEVMISVPAGVTSTERRAVIEAAIKGDKCVEDTEYMRKNHMKLLLHQRDKTVHQGIRTKRHSLKNCIECHASKTNNSVAASKENFCQSCHSYTAVKLDCFECHATKPASATAAGRSIGTAIK